MIKKQNSILNNRKLFFYIAAAFSLFRILLSWWIGSYCNTIMIHDDYLMIQYANLPQHFLEANELSLVKTMSFPLFLNIPRLTGLTYNVLLSLVWIVAGLVVWRVFRSFTKNPVYELLVYLYVIFNPYSFDYPSSVIYRNGILVPFLFIVIGLMLKIVITSWKKEQGSGFNIVLDSILLGVVYTFTYYIKEDGFWMIPVLYFMMAVSFLGILYNLITLRKYKKLVSVVYYLVQVLCLLLPITEFHLLTNEYKSINEKYFGVYEVNTRTQGEISDFINNVYQIASDNRTKYVWAPYDAIEKAFAVSPTLQSLNGFEEAVLSTPWFSNGDTPITGDFLGWVTNTALKDTGNWTTEKELQDVFSQVNQELEAAFNNGNLQKETKFSLVRSAGGRNWSETFDLLDDVLYQLNLVISPTIVRESKSSPSERISQNQEAALLTNMNVQEIANASLENQSLQLQEFGLSIANGIALIYRIINTVLIILGIVTWFWCAGSFIGKKLKNRTVPLSRMDWILYWSIFVLTGLAAGYSFGIAWFSEFLYRDDLNAMQYWLIYYSGGTFVFLSLVIICVFFFIQDFWKEEMTKRFIRQEEKRNQHKKSAQNYAPGNQTL